MYCKLCLQEKQLCRSHIVPEFFHKSMYDEKHRFFGLSIKPENKVQLFQKGITERLLCRECEQQLGRYERYASRVLYGGEKISINKSKNLLHLSNLDYKKIRLFLLSIIWRFSINKNSTYNTATLGPHEDTIRKMILEENPGEPEKYPCLMVIVTLDGNHIHDIIIPPSLNKVNGHFVWRVVVGGLLLSFFISNHKIPAIINAATIRKEGTAIIPIKEITEMEFLYKLIKDMAEADLIREQMK